MRLGVVSDTHGNLGNTRKAIDILEKHEVDCVLHCGDIGSVDVIPLFDRWPAHFVFGNVDQDEDRLRREIEAAGQTCHDRFGDLEIEGVHIALIHSDDARLFDSVTTSEEYDLVCFGHTHRAEERRIGRTLLLNPGALHRAPFHSISIVDLPSLATKRLVLA